jgi:hypothetical protein
MIVKGVIFAAMAVALALSACSDDQPGGREQSPEDLLSRLSKEPPSEELCLLVELVCGKPENQGKAACQKLASACASLSLEEDGAPGGAAKDGAPGGPSSDLPPPQDGPPDLVVTAVGWQPKSPQANDAVTFSATIKNAGSGPTPAGTILGVRFSIDGAVVTWSDHEKNALGPGKSVTVTANGGPTGSSTWKATQGTVSVEAWVDDIDRIPGESDEGNNTLAASLTVGGSAPPSQTGACAAAPPPGAKAAGLTKLAFCDDFDDPGTFDLKGTEKPGFKWYRTSLMFGRAPEPESAFKWKNGVLEVKGTNGGYQLNFQSAVRSKKSGDVVGFYIDRETAGWYVEARLSHNQWSGTSGFFAFWTMDMCHLYSHPAYCSEYFEPDFYEYISTNHNNSFHYWGDDKTKSPSHYKIDKCISANTPGIGKDKTGFNVFGARFTPQGASYFFNDKANITNACGGKAWTKQIPTGPTKMGTKTGRYPILVGAGPNQPYKLDWVRVWVKP